MRRRVFRIGIFCHDGIDNVNRPRDKWSGWNRAYFSRWTELGVSILGEDRLNDAATFWSCGGYYGKWGH